MRNNSEKSKLKFKLISTLQADKEKGDSKVMDNYHFYEEVGKGKYSVVHKARKKKTINYYAVKSLQKCRREKVKIEKLSLMNHNKQVSEKQVSYHCLHSISLFI